MGNGVIGNYELGIRSLEFGSRKFEVGIGNWEFGRNAEGGIGN